MKVEDVASFLRSMKPKVFLKERELFNPLEFHIELSFGVYHYQGENFPAYFAICPVAYMAYDYEKKEVKGISADLVPTLIRFLNHTNNHHLIGEIKTNLG